MPSVRRGLGVSRSTPSAYRPHLRPGGRPSSGATVSRTQPELGSLFHPGGTQRPKQASFEPEPVCEVAEEKTVLTIRVPRDKARCGDTQLRIRFSHLSPGDAHAAGRRTDVENHGIMLTCSRLPRTFPVGPADGHLHPRTLR